MPDVVAEEDFAELLSMHYFYAQQHEDAWKFSVAAGGRAEAKFAPVQAESFYVRALGSAKHVAGVTAVELSEQDLKRFDELAPAGATAGARYANMSSVDT